jgi:hypothetical protein
MSRATVGPIDAPDPANNAPPWTCVCLQRLKPGQSMVFWKGTRQHLDDEIEAQKGSAPCYAALLTAIRDCAFKLEAGGMVVLEVRSGGVTLVPDGEGHMAGVRLYEHVATAQPKRITCPHGSTKNR